MKGSQSRHSGRNLETGAEAETMTEWFVQLTFLYNSGPLAKHGATLTDLGPPSAVINKGKSL